MHKVAALALALAAVGACSKKEADAPAAKTAEPAAAAKPAPPDEKMAPTPEVVLPAAGTAPAAVTVTKELDPMWTSKFSSLQGQPMSLADYKGKALLIVNVASKCGNTPQYAALEALQKKYESKGFTVVGFPCNQFGGQEPGTAAEIQTFCKTTYGVTFPMTEKIEVNGPGRHEVYKALTAIKDADGHDGDIRWNFEKFVVSADGTKVTRFSPKVKPDDPSVVASIEQALPH